MHRILYIFLFALLAASCNKSKCWQCTVVSAGTEFTERICDKSKKDIDELQANPQETKDKDGQVIYTTTYSNCIED